MSIQPNSTIKLLHQVPLNPNQEDTLWFATRTEQTFYFNSKVVRTFPLNTYQRANKGVCRLNAIADELYDINYMMFQNTNYSNRWFYAFVDGVDYVNDNACEVRYTLDPLQTWLLDYQTDQCFIERCHTPTDYPGDYIEPESFELGEYVYNDFNILTNDTDTYQSRVVVAYMPNDTDTGSFVDGVYSACVITCWSSADLTELNEFIQSFASNPESIVGIYMVPAFVVNYKQGGETYRFSNTEHYKINMVTTTDTLDGYKPKNNKMYTFPYTYLSVENNNAQSMALRYEFFDKTKNDGKVGLHVMGVGSMPVEINCVAEYYKGADYDYIPSTKLSLKGFPLCNYGIDAYKAWLAQNSVPMLVNASANIVKGAITGLAGGLLATKNPTGGILGAISGTTMSLLDQVKGNMNEEYKSQIRSDISGGSYETGNLDFAKAVMYFYYGRKSITHQMARRIDNFFTMYGYSNGKVEFPNIYARSRYTYIKTIGCNIYGTLPSKDAQYIANCYDKGIRFWHDHTHFGDYTIDNTPLEQ